MSEKPLKKGFTTGAAAAAAAKAALYFLLTGEKKTKVKIRFLTGEERFIDIFEIKKISDTIAQCIVIKDAGDDPDITHKAQIGVKLSLLKTSDNGLKIVGGNGVGIVTKPGLELDVGEYAINPGPKKMIREAIENVFLDFKKKASTDLVIEVFVPKGEELATKTLNARLGIVGGISILGTTGIVVPMSHDAYIATIKAGAKIAAAGGANTLVYTTGRRSERFAMKLFHELKEECFIQTGDFFKASIDEAVKIEQIDSLVFTVFFGKAVKMAMGFEHTHAAKSDLTMKNLADWAGKICFNKTLVKNIQNANTARHAFSYIFPEFPELISYVGNKIKENAEKFAANQLAVRSIIFDFDGNPIYDSHGFFIS
ncbi:MAG: cobalt-precorrin-5B (C(1))-methyltransferase [Desulfobacteraceae bacterium]|nr:cobalt-precorrin-5B (C(1))-methyltransferase [Desulfobacteraceae bacterium]